jgi:hypothetical protein
MMKGEILKRAVALAQKVSPSFLDRLEIFRK